MNHFFYLLFSISILTIGVVRAEEANISLSLPFTKPAKAPVLIQKQEQGRVFSQVLNNANQGPVSIVISLSRQRALVYIGNRLAIDSPISSGKRTGMTPKGQFTILEKDLNHRSTIYGNFVDNLGRVVKAGVSTRIDSAPSGTHFVGAPMKRFLRITPRGVGLHAGYLPGYPDSHGCIRLPADMATIIYNMVSLGTPVVVE